MKRPAFVLKKTLLFIPLFGLYLLKAEQIPIDRTKGPSALRRMAQAARRALHARRAVIIFPEGTRRAPGEKFAAHPGVAALYSQLKVPVVPVRMETGHVWGRNAFVKKPGLAVVEFLPAIAPGLFTSREFLEELGRRLDDR